MRLCSLVSIVSEMCESSSAINRDKNSDILAKNKVFLLFFLSWVGL